ncbi:MAG: DUF6782 family putative metallopeptidase [Elusimicrobiota bacterium]|nr:DUF6782 family putative metallopeptidase [Elusimicrobiota bacterium]
MTSFLLALLLAVPGEARVLAIPRVTPSISAMPRLPLVLPRGGQLAAAAPLALTPSVLPSLPFAPAPTFPVAPSADRPAPLGGVFDGSAERSDEAVTGSDLSWLASGDPRVAAALEQAADLANQTKIGRRVLWEAAQLLQSMPLPVDALDLGKNHGEFDYLERRLRLHRKLLRPESRAQLAATLVHELRHVIQHSQGVPAEAIEMEIEAHLDDLALMRELGVEPPPKTFARQLHEALLEGPERFVEILGWALPERPRLAAMTWAKIEADLLEQLKHAKRGKSERKKKLVAAIERDLALVRSKEGRASYRAFSRRVEARLKREAEAAKSR